MSVKNINRKALAGGLAVLMAVCLFAGISVEAAAKTSLSQSRVTLKTGESTVVKVKNTAEKVSWKILTGKKNISVKAGKKSAKITGKNAGKANLQAKVGNRKLTCHITVMDEKNPNTEKGFKITVKSGKYTVVYQLNNSQAAKELYDQLPLTLEVENFSDNEKIFYPPKELKTGGAPKSEGKKGSLSYYEPWGDVVMFYKSAGSASSLYELGTVVSGEENISKLSGKITISKSSS